jgi:hypothetical protein
MVTKRPEGPAIGKLEEEVVMKALLSKVLVCGLLVAGVGGRAARAQNRDNDGCTNATLRGDYAFTVTGRQSSPSRGLQTRDKPTIPAKTKTPAVGAIGFLLPVLCLWC